MKATVAALVCLYPLLTAWADPADDAFGLDIIDVQVVVRSDALDILFGLNPATTNPGDAEQLIAFLDLDTDQNTETGRVSHLEEFAWEPYPQQGVDFFVLFLAQANARVFRLDDGTETDLGEFAVSRTDYSVSVTIPRCYPGAPVSSPACIEMPTSLSGVFGHNFEGLTDRWPNDQAALVASWVGDFDQNGLVDGNDLEHMQVCRTRSRIPQTLPSCLDADLDGDRDIDPDDFGLLQRSIHTP